MDRILLVDGDPVMRPLLEHILLDNGYQVVTAESVATATRLLGSQPFDLILCDVNLPDGSGLTVADRAIAAGVKALVVTGYGMRLEPGSLAPCAYLSNPLRVIHGRDQIRKNPVVASAMTTVANHPTTSIGRGSVSRPMMCGFIAITIMTAISGAASTPLTTALQ